MQFFKVINVPVFNKNGVDFIQHLISIEQKLPFKSNFTLCSSILGIILYYNLIFHYHYVYFLKSILHIVKYTEAYFKI